MINVSEQYKLACQNGTRKSYVMLKIGTTTRKFDYSTEEATNTKFSNPDVLFDIRRMSTIKYISCEQDRVSLDGTFYFMKDKTQDVNNIAFWGNELSNENGTLNEQYLNFIGEEIKEYGLTIYFEELCTSFTVEYFNRYGSKVFSFEVNDNKDLIYHSTQKPSTIVDYDQIIIYFNQTLPNRRVKVNKIVIGDFIYFTDQEIDDYSITKECDPVSLEYRSNTMNVTLIDNDGTYDIMNINDNGVNENIDKLYKYKQMTMYHYLLVNGKYEEVPLCTTMIEKISINNGKIELQGNDRFYYITGTYYNGKVFPINSQYDYPEEQAIKDFFNYYGMKDFLIIDNFPYGANSISWIGTYINEKEFKDALVDILQASYSIFYVDSWGYGHIKFLSKTTNENGNYIFQRAYPNENNCLFTRNMIFSERPQYNEFNSAINITASWVVTKINKNYELEFVTSSEQVEVLSKNNVQAEKTIRLSFEKYPIVVDDTNKGWTIVQHLEEDDVQIFPSNTEVNATNILITPEDDMTISVLAYTYETYTYIENSDNTFVKRGNWYVDEIVEKLHNLNGQRLELSDNTLFDNNGATQYILWYYQRPEIQLNFDTIVTPYIEIGDICTYITKYGKSINFMPTKIEYTKSIIQTIQGE